MLFLSRLCKKTLLVSRFRFWQQNPSADFYRQQIFFLSADSISKFLSSADLFFVSKCLCRRHGNDAHAGICRFAPASFLSEKFSPSAGARFRFYHESILFAGGSGISASLLYCTVLLYYYYTLPSSAKMILLFHSGTKPFHSEMSKVRVCYTTPPYEKVNLDH